jgi:hypothetical protein
MAEGIVYLDVDDEITSAASRIRSSPGTKVALVVPNGSRIATSRINFRLLSREALVSNRRLSVIAGEPASRALAASAGLPVFATIAEYEAALAGPSAAVDEDSGKGAVRPASEPVPRPEPAPRPSPRSKRGARAEAAAAAATAATAAAAATSTASPRIAGESSQMTVPFDTPPATGDERAFEQPEPRTLPVVVGNRFRVRASVAAVLAALALAVVVVAVAGFLLLPSATIALTPRQDTVGPIQVTIAADPTATAVDAAKGVVPAVRLDVPAEASQTFTTTGKKVTEAAASGSVTFTNYDPTSSNSIAAGSIVSTEGGIGFRTLAAVTVARAAFTPPSTTVPSHASVRIQAVNPGSEGNVPANAIRVVPPGENPTFLAVANPNPTSGGVHTETPQVSKAEVDKAVATLQKALQASFDDAISAGAGAPTGTELFPSTAAMGAPTFSVNPTSLVGQAMNTFDLGVSATGTVIAVDPSPVRSIAEARLHDRIGADHRLVDGSIQVDVGKGSVGEDGQVSFEATARAAEVTVVDPNQLRALVKGRTASEAEAALAPFGVAKVELWPAWVTTVTGVDARLSISVVGQDAAAGSGGAGSPARSAGAAPSTATPAPSAASPGAPQPSPSPSPSAASAAS